MDPIVQHQPSKGEAKERYHCVRRRRRIKQTLNVIVRTVDAINEELNHFPDPAPVIVLDHLSTATVALDTCLRRLTRPARAASAAQCVTRAAPP